VHDDLRPEQLSANACFVYYRPVRRTRRDHRYEAAAIRHRALDPDGPRALVVLGVRGGCGHRLAHLFARARDQDAAHACIEERLDDRHHLIGRLAVGQHRLGRTLT
jgi:hypothetical protein